MTKGDHVTKRVTIAVGLALAVLGTTGCGLLDLASGSGEDTGITAGLAELPQPDDGEYTVRVVDLDAATEAAGLERPTDLSPEAITAWVGPLSGMKRHDSFAPVIAPMPEVTNPRMAYQMQEFHDIAGWSAVDVTSYAEVVDLPGTFASLAGDFDDSTLEHLPEVADGVRTVGDGEDGRGDISRRTVVQPMGAPVRMAHRDGRLAVSSSTSDSEEWLEGGPESTLADDPRASALAEALDAQDVISAHLVVGSDFRAGAFAGTPGAAQQAGPLPEKPFDAVGVGWAAPDGEPRMVAVYHFADAESAEASVGPLEELFTDGRDMRGRELAETYGLDEVTSDGSVVTVTLGASRPGAAGELSSRLVRRDVPFQHS